MNTFEKARQFIYRNARPLDLARWQYHFEKGSRENVLHALSFYQNPDGGFGHGIEPDFLNPDSTPIAVWAAAEIISEVGLTDKSHPMITGILRYLESGADFDYEQNQWRNTVPTNNDYPHAIWWEYNDGGEYKYNPTAALAAFIIRFADSSSELYGKACELAEQAIKWFVSAVPFDEQHVTGCFITLYNALAETDISIADMALFKEKLCENVTHTICHDTEKWAAEYVTKPSALKVTRDSIFYADNERLAQYECEFIRSSQLPDGSFTVPWQWWTDYKEFEVSANRWKSSIIISNMLYLKANEK
ncbi:MAG: hypothetical protein J6A37_16055 [Oscillospiraceae bacterium]|nr:hypothetical protein [Oscillospiraceae bacterium]